jgi:hypothetical protein
VERNQTRSAAEFVAAMAEVFLGRGGDVLERITHQSFDVRPSPFYLYPVCLSVTIVFLREDRRWSSQERMDVGFGM